MEKTNVYRLSLVRDAEVKYECGNMSDDQTASRLIRETIKKRGQTDREQLVVILLNGANHVIGVNIAHVGTINSCMVNPREIFKAALLSNATAIILGHNHPCLQMNPSPEDYSITEQLIYGAELLGLKILDHVIVDLESDRFCSLETEARFCSQTSAKARKKSMELKFLGVMPSVVNGVIQS